MSASQEQPDSSDEDYEDDAIHAEGQWPTQALGDDDIIPLSPALTSGATSSSQQQAHPMQKRRRVTRACDECRRKKIKCDGRQPCTHCTVYSYDCTYDQPSNRRRNPAPQYVDALEVKLQRAEAIIKAVLPNVNLDDPSLDHRLPPNVPSGLGQALAGKSHAQFVGWEAPITQRPDSVEAETESMLESMVEDTGSLDLDDEGHWDFHGHSSGRAFLRKMRDQFGDLMGKTDISNVVFPPGRRSRAQNSPLITSPPTPSVGSPLVQRVLNTSDLPTRDCAVPLCANALDDACAILRFVHQPTFYAMVDRIYDTQSENLGPEELEFLPLFYSTLALGILFATNERSSLINNGFDSAIDRGTHFFQIARSMVDVTDCRDLISLQTRLMMILFLQSSSRLSTCYSHLGIVLRSSLRLGLHRNVQNHFNPIEQEVRKRIFWCVRKLDIYIGALLGLPKLLSDEDIDQEFPLEVDDDCITAEQILPMPPDKPSLMTAFNAHTRIVQILAKAVKYIYPVKGNKSKTGHSYIVSHSRIREIEQDLQRWFESLPMPFRPGMEAPQEFIRIQHLLRMAYAHIEMMVYRPFLHYVSADIQSTSVDKRSYACAAACVSVSRNIVHLTGEMKRKGLLIGSYWFYMYTTFFAVISLVFFVLESPGGETSAAILRDAHEGRDTLAGLAKRSLAADRCSRHLAELFEQLPERLETARVNSASQKRRQPASPSPAPLPVTQPHMLQSIPDMHRITPSEPNPRRAQTLPLQHTWQPPKGVFDQHPQRFNPNYCGTATHAYNSSGASSSAMTGGPLTTPQTPSAGSTGLLPPITQQQQQPSTFTDLTLHSVPDLSAMMFPTSDPFAYPNQPMTTLENQNVIKHELGNEDLCSPTTTAATATTTNNTATSTTTTTPVNPFQTFDMNYQIPNFLIPSGPLPPPPPLLQQDGNWDIQPPHPHQGGTTGAEDPRVSDDMTGVGVGVGVDVAPWPPTQTLQQQQQQQQQTQQQTQRSYDQLFGEDWGGWMSQGYRQ